MNKKKILLIITELRPAGAEKIVYTIASQLKQEFEFHVACLSKIRGEVGDWLQAENIPVLYLDIDSKYQFWKLIPLFRYIQKYQIPLIHTHLFHANLIGRVIGSLAGCKNIISTVHIIEKRYRPWHFWFDRWTQSLISYEVCVSQAALEYTQKKAKIHSQKLIKISNGIDMKPFLVSKTPSSDFSFSVKNFLKLKEEPDFVIGNVGHFRLQKGHIDLIEAFSEFRQKHQEKIYLVLIGEGEQKKSIQKLVLEKGLQDWILFLGYRSGSDIPECFKCFDLFVFPSLYEGFGLSVLEAMASRTLVLATQIEALEELIKEGETGYFVPVSDRKQLAQKMEKLFLEKGTHQEVIEKAFEHSQQFSLERMVEQYKSLYYRCLKKN